ncbi:MAG: flippase-like domain-containing protein [Elusimicrobia bacterium]|nr:flippase-like domain-containing protein [Elusimicrobiota bacterium]
MKTKLSIIGGLAFGILLMYLAFRNIDIKNLVEIYSQTNPLYLIPLAFLLIIEVFVRGLRWKILLDPVKKIKVMDTFKLEAIGLAFNNILPLRLGEIIRGVLCARKLDISVITVFSTILVERVMDTITLFVLVMVAIRFDGYIGASNLDVYFWLILFVLGIGLLSLIFIEKILLHHKLTGIFLKFPRLSDILKNIAHGAKAFQNFKRTSGIILCGLTQWSINISLFYLVAKIFNINEIINIFKAVKLIFTTAVAVSVPAMPGYFGNLEYSISKVMSLWGISEEIGFAYATYLHLSMYVVVTVVGVFFVYQMGYSIGDLYRQSKKWKNKRK